MENNIEYNIGDKVWIMYHNEPTELEITSIAKKQYRKYYGDDVVSDKIVYGLGWKKYTPDHGLFYIIKHVYEDSLEEYISKHYLEEYKFFRTKKELLDSLL